MVEARSLYIYLNEASKRWAYDNHTDNVGFFERRQYEGGKQKLNSLYSCNL